MDVLLIFKLFYSCPEFAVVLTLKGARNMKTWNKPKF